MSNLISVVIPTYNRFDYLLNALKSVSLSDLLNPEEFLKTQNTDTAVLHT